MKVKILSFALMVAIFGGCSFNGFMGEPTSTSNRNVVIQKVDKDDLREVMKKEKQKLSHNKDKTPSTAHLYSRHRSMGVLRHF